MDWKHRVVPKEAADFYILESEKTSLWRRAARSYVRPCRNCSSVFGSLLSFFPFLRWIPKYSPGERLFGDIMGGLTIGILNVPQGMAYAALAAIPLVNGLNSAFLAGLLYPLFSDWPHGSLGPFAIVELMSGSAVRRLVDLDESLDPSSVVSALTFFVGILTLICALLRTHFVAKYFSESIVSGFVTAAAFHVLIAQFDSLLGIQKRRFSGPAYLFREVAEMAKKLTTANPTTMLISLASILFLLFGKFGLDPLIRRFVGRRLIVPYELFLVVGATIVSYFLDFGSEYNVAIVGEIPRGLPFPSIPKIFLLKELFWDSLSITFVHVAVHHSILKVSTVREKYRVDHNQELYATGAVLSLSSAFPVFPAVSGLNRPFILSECGSSSQIANLISGFLVLAVLLSVGPLFFWLPLCTLSSVIVVALRNLFLGFSQTGKFWRHSRWDFCIWLFTFLVTIFVDVVSGLVGGLCFEMFTVVWRTQWPKWESRFSRQKDLEDFCVFRFGSLLLFSNSDCFRKAVTETLSKWNGSGIGLAPRVFIFDCGAIGEMDTAGAESFSEAIGEVRKVAGSVLFAHVDPTIRRQLISLGVHSNRRDFFENVAEAIWASRTPTDRLPVIVASTNPFDVAQFSPE